MVVVKLLYSRGHNVVEYFHTWTTTGDVVDRENSLWTLSNYIQNVNRKIEMMLLRYPVLLTLSVNEIHWVTHNVQVNLKKLLFNCQGVLNCSADECACKVSFVTV